MPVLKKKELFDLSGGQEVQCSWCRKYIALGALCCPYCRNDGPSMPWKKELKHFSFVFRPGMHKKTSLCYKLSVDWLDSCGQKFWKSYLFFCQGSELDGSTDYLAEIDVPVDANMHISLTRASLNHDGSRSNDNPCHTKDGLDTVILHDPGKYMVTMFMEAERRLLTTRYTPFFSVERIG